MKRLNNIEDKSGEQLKTIENKKDNQLDIKSVTHILVEELLNLVTKKKLLTTQSLTLGGIII